MRLTLVAALLALPVAAASAQTPAGTTSKAARGTPAKKRPARAAAPVVAPAPATTAAETPVPAEPVPAGPSATELASERARLQQLRDTTEGLIRLMVEEGLITREKAARLLGGTAAPAAAPGAATAGASADAAAPAVPDAGVAEAGSAAGDVAPRRKRGQSVRVPYVPETVKAEIRDQIKQEVLAQAKSERWAEPGALPEWLDRISWEGDLRLRFQADRFEPDNTPAINYNAIAGTNLQNTQSNEQLWRIRMRLGMLARVTDTIGIGVRLATGNLQSPVTANQVMGNGSAPYQFLIDRAYFKWDPNDRLSVTAGRIGNPWFWPTDLVWDEDLNFEGAALSVKPTLTASTSAFGTVGAFALESGGRTPTAPNASNKWLYGAQAGVEWQGANALRAKLAGALFEYSDVEGRPNRDPLAVNANDWTRPRFRQKGNSVVDLRFDQSTQAIFSDYGLASRFRVANLSGELDVGYLDPFHVRVSGDYARNIGFNQSEILARTGLLIEPKINAWQLRLTVGSDALRARHDWQAFVGYRYIERDAVLDAFADSNFFLGGTDTKGYTAGLLYALDRNVNLRFRYLSGSPISGPASGTGTDLRLPLEIDVLQVDLGARF